MKETQLRVPPPESLAIVHLMEYWFSSYVGSEVLFEAFSYFGVVSPEPA